GDDNPKAVTEEEFRLLNSPAWSPDGELLAGRKHFTSTRSLGAGEIWLYHRSGGGGLQVTEKPNDQKDLGEPTFSPDGRYVYYSQDTTPGPVFEYNKDPNQGIYTIKRLDRETGETIDLLGGPGGAVRPTPSPDGRLLAFVKRVRARSVLTVADLGSGEEWPVFDGLDRDMQQTWAIHGVYPHMAWTPDSTEVVFWAGGKIHRVDVRSRQLREIPFHVAATRTVIEPLRFPVEVAPASFEVKMVRWAQVSPDHRASRAGARGRLAFQALGRIWVKDLPDGAPRRLTRQEDHFEYYPSWSRDGREVVYATWDDRELGAVRVVSAAGGAGRKLTADPGFYLEPAFSPDGRWVVYRKDQGGYLTSPLWAAELGVYRVPAGGLGAGDEPALVSREGSGPHFGAASDRVFLTRRADQKTVLFSVPLTGPAEEVKTRDHLRSENATYVRVSPDGRWVAWQERYQAHVAPFVATGKTIELGPEAKSLPVATVSRDAGNFLHWSGDSDALHWTVGPELFTRGLTESFAFLEGAPEELPEPPAEGVAIGLTAEAAKPSGTIALVGARLVTMRGDEVVEDGVVVIEGDRIAAVGARGEVEVPAGAQVIDAAGKTVIPGLIDVHWHGGHGEGPIEPEQNWNYFASLAFGVTTVHDPSADTATVFSSSEMARAGLITAPRVYSTGTILYGAETPFQVVIESLEDARSHLRRMKAQGAISVKSYNQPRRDQRQQVVQAARELEMMVVPEGGSLYQHNMTMVVDGHTGIEHSIPVGAIYDDTRQLWRATPVGYTPTLVVGYGGLWGENYWYAKTNVWEDERLLTFVPREEVDARSRRRVLAPDDDWGHFENARVAAELQDDGVKVLLGAHGQREGLAAHWEMWMMEQGGMTPHEVLRAATLDGAWYLGMDRDLGSIEPGKLADLAILSANPLEDLRSSTSVEQVMVGGRLYDAATLDQIAP
ncbi:MAG TPA: amidohydrolase family protein, partial [Thermoanaerobaculia bacterium]|nr:amidohydrolase family protein [Thermoanaerobaculia bacterium]